MRELRESELTFRKNNGRYGSLKELVESQLVSPSLADGEDAGNQFQIRANENTYEAVSFPSHKNDAYEYVGWTSYLNESGVIRGRAYGKASSYTLAGKSDPPVRYQ